MHIHTAPLGDDHVLELNGLRCTGAARTVFDLACSIPFEQAVAIADAGLLHQLCTADELTEMVGCNRGRHGRAQVQLVLAFADGRSESVDDPQPGGYPPRRPTPARP